MSMMAGFAALAFPLARRGQRGEGAGCSPQAVCYIGNPGLCWIWQQFNLCVHPPPNSLFPSPSHQTAGMSNKVVWASRQTEAAASLVGNHSVNWMSFEQGSDLEMNLNTLRQCPELQTDEGCRRSPSRLVLFCIFPSTCSRPPLEIRAGGALEIALAAWRPQVCQFPCGCACRSLLSRVSLPCRWLPGGALPRHLLQGGR